jgi:hypothetical protein
MFPAFLGVVYYYRWFGKIRTYASHVFCDPLKQSFCGRIGTVSPAMFALFTSFVVAAADLAVDKWKVERTNGEW